MFSRIFPGNHDNIVIMVSSGNNGLALGGYTRIYEIYPGLTSCFDLFSMDETGGLQEHVSIGGHRGSFYVLFDREKYLFDVL